MSKTEIRLVCIFCVLIVAFSAWMLWSTAYANGWCDGYEEADGSWVAFMDGLKEKKPSAVPQTEKQTIYLEPIILQPEPEIALAVPSGDALHEPETLPETWKIAAEVQQAETICCEDAAECEEDAIETLYPCKERDGLVLLDTFIATAYCDTGLTATGTTTTEGRTLAVNPEDIPYGTHVWLYLDDGTFVGDYYAEDTGGNLLRQHYVIDIYDPDYEWCVEWGARHVSVWEEE